MKRRRLPSLTKTASIFFSGVAVLSLLLLIGLFVVESVPAWKEAGTHLITGKQWFYRKNLFGVAPMIYGSLAVGFVALALSAPLGVLAALFSAAFMPRWLQLPYKVAIELLAGVPSVVYGLLGILLLRGWVYRVFERFDPLSGDTLLTGGILLAVMLLPTIVSLSDDAFRSVPSSQILAARGLGLNASEAAVVVTFRQALPGVFASLFLAAGRACGEMIAVFLVIGRQDNQWPEKLLSAEPLLAAGQTLSTKLGGSETNIAYGDPLHWAALIACGLVLLAIVTLFALLGLKLRKSSSHAA